MILEVLQRMIRRTQGDPDFGEPTPELIEWLVSKEYGRERAKLINMGR